MKKTLMLSLLAIGVLVTTACSLKTETYDENSRQTHISEYCNSFFDGCNNCQKISNSNDVACTKMYCETYQKPECLDAMDPSRDQNNDGINDCESDGTCDDSIDYRQPKTI